MEIFGLKLAENLMVGWICKELTQKRSGERKQMYPNIIPNLIVYLLFIWKFLYKDFPFCFRRIKSLCFPRNDYFVGWNCGPLVEFSLFSSVRCAGMGVERYISKNPDFGHDFFDNFFSSASNLWCIKPAPDFPLLFLRRMAEKRFTQNFFALFLWGLFFKP